jgi:prevent-host-death family protein
MAKTIGIAVAKARLFEIIDRVESGETIIIARNGAPVAQLQPLERESVEDAKRIAAVGQRIPNETKPSVIGRSTVRVFLMFPNDSQRFSRRRRAGNEPRSTM